MKLKKEVRVNFASTQDFAGFSGHATSMVFTHPLQVVRIVSASFKSSSVPRPKSFALCAEHLITSVGLVDENLAIRARFSVGLQKSDGSDSVRVAHM